jgi:hypothetical protein
MGSSICCDMATSVCYLNGTPTCGGGTTTSSGSAGGQMY